MLRTVVLYTLWPGETWDQVLKNSQRTCMFQVLSGESIEDLTAQAWAWAKENARILFSEGMKEVRWSWYESGVHPARAQGHYIDSTMIKEDK